MTNAMDVLFSYAQEWMELALLLNDPEYAEAQRCADAQEQRLRASLSREAVPRLEDYLEERKLLLFFEKQALFRAGFQLAMELGR